MMGARLFAAGAPSPVFRPIRVLSLGFLMFELDNIKAKHPKHGLYTPELNDLEEKESCHPEIETAAIRPLAQANAQRRLQAAFPEAIA